MFNRQYFRWPTNKRDSQALCPSFEISGSQHKREAMFHVCQVTVLVLASLWLVKGQPGIVRQAVYDVLRNTSTGPIVCALDQPHTVRNDTRSRLHCSTTCLQNDQCSSFNYKDVGDALTCEHFKGYPFNFSVDPACRHYAVRTK